MYPLSPKIADERIQIILVTGFLGAGKTTLVNHLLSGSLGKGAGLLVNDFGDIVVDGCLIRKELSPENERVKIFEVAGGSIFCSCKTADFALGMRMFAGIRPERLIVEASGMADPSGMDRLLFDYRLAADFCLARVVCITDAVRTPRMMENLPALKRQIEAADLVLINKCDLAEENELRAFESGIRLINPGADVQRTIRADVNMEKLAGSARRRPGAHTESSDTPDSRPGTLQLESDGLPRKALDAFLHDQIGATWRIKGWVRTSDNWWYVSDNAGRIEWMESPLPDGHVPGLTVITPPGGAQAVADAWRDFSGSGNTDDGRV
jgi:G3E family GTPase